MISLKEMMNRKKNGKEDDRILRIDCRNCPDEPDVGSVGCIKCLCSNIDIKRQPVEILLRSGSEIRVDQSTTDVINGIAEGYYSIPVGRSDKQCQGCIMSSESLEAEKWCGLSLDNTNEILEKLDSVYVNCPWGRDCIESARRGFVQMNENMELISKEAAKNAYKLI